MEPWDFRACASTEPWYILNCSLICSNSFDNKDNTEYENEVQQNLDWWVLCQVPAPSLVTYYENYLHRVPCRTSMRTGHKFIEETFKGHGIRCYQSFCLKKSVFLDLRHELTKKYGLYPTKGMSVYEEVGMFLMACAHGVDNRLLQEDCIGAIDGTHVKDRLPQRKSTPYIGRKGFASQNILAVVDFNMCFTFAWAR
ncbi:hypothetical protein BUALT_Bualt09G0006800 [Buddleja alternifolia]|uniref:DUF8040 domain-containing protein n=1 Tax=Buddleja alternifolia TaxID=168488 RepID=A0AAV6WY36_9LAMI|nr:hypothetical protein BUALT_Bualt09G0006800 [Buddleja alternifolia]